MQTIGTVSKNLGISSRMLRYYEQIGLIRSRRVEDYAYRVYDEEADGLCFEEILNYYNLMNNGAKMEDTQIDLLLPIKEMIK